MKINEDIRKFLSENGKKGAKAWIKKLTKKQLKEKMTLMSLKAAKVRLSKKKNLSTK